MDVAEATALLAYVKQVKPSQRIDEFTADAWADVMDDVPFDAAMKAVRVVLRSGAWAEPHLIIEEVAAQRRAEREKARPGALIPAADADDPMEFIRALRAGRFQPEAPKSDRNVEALVSSVAKALPSGPSRREHPRPALRPARELPTR